MFSNALVSSVRRAFVLLLLVSNIVFALARKEEFSNRFQNRLPELLE